MRVPLIGLLVLLLFSVHSPAQAAGFDLDRPVDGAVLRGFDDVARYAAGHRGVDLAASRGEPVRAAAAGRVHFAGVVAGTPSVSIDHGNGWRTTYVPVRATVEVGEAVAAGDALGTLLPGHCPSTCLHWGLTDGLDYADPLQYLSVPWVRLLPHGSQPRVPPPIGEATIPPSSGSLPVAGTISSRFGPRRHPITGVTKLHDGVDVAAPCGTPVRAWAAGTVTRTGYHGAYGYRVFVTHETVMTAYTHLPGLDVSVGQEVAAGQQIGRVGNTGLSTGCHLHWMAWRSGQLVDPLTLTQ